MSNMEPSVRFPWLHIFSWSIIAGLLYAQFHLFGNTTEVESFGRSAFAWMFTLWKSARIFGGSPYYLGWLMPVVALALIYRMRGELAHTTRYTFWPGLLAVAFALFLHWAGARAQQTRLSLLALILLLWSIPLFLAGPRVAKKLVFPAVLLVFCVPLNFLDAVIFPMRVLSAAGAELLANGLGFAVEQAGAAIRLSHPALTIDGSDPASGLGTLLSLVAAVLAGGAWLKDPWWCRLTLPVLAVPCLIFCASLRLLIAAAIARWVSISPALFFHERMGFIFVLGMSLVALILIRSRLLRLRAA